LGEKSNPFQSIGGGSATKPPANVVKCVE